jgi:hypothetical protein
MGRRESRSIYGAAWAYRDVRWLLAGYVPSRAGDFLYAVALVVVVYEATGSPAWVAAVAVATRLPLVVLPPFVGGLAARFGAVRLLVALDLAQAVTVATLAVAVVLGSSPVVLIAIATVASVFTTPVGAALVTLLPQVVQEDDLAATNGVLGSLDCLAIIAGPVAGAALVVVGEPWLAFAVNAVTFLLSAAALSRVRGAGPVPRRATTPGDADAAPAAGGAWHGFRLLARDPAVLLVSLGVVAVCFTYGSTTVTLLLLSETVLGTGSAGLGYLLAALGVGGFLGSLLSARVGAARRGALVVALLLGCTGLTAAALALVQAPLVAYAVVALFGGGYLLLEVLAVTVMQRALSQSEVGPATGALDGLAFGTILLGALAAPVVVDALGLAGGLVALALPTLLSAVGVAAFVRRLDSRGAARVADLEPRLALLARVDALAGASQAAREQLAAALVPVPVAAGGVVVREGEPSDDFFVVADGSLDVLSSGGTGAVATHVGTLGAGDHFGEIGLLRHTPRSATVRAVTDVVVHRAPGAVFLAVVQGSTDLTSRFGSVASSRLARTHRGAHAG